jgi:putative non-specific DNA binding protein
MIKYVIQAKKNPLKKNEVKYYPQMAPTTPMSLAQILKRVEKRSTVSRTISTVFTGQNTYS